MSDYEELAILSFRLLVQCSQYFHLRCRLFDSLSSVRQDLYQLDISAMMDDEIGWLTNFNVSSIPEIQEIDNVLLSGHIDLIRALVTCEGMNKIEYGMDHAFSIEDHGKAEVFLFALRDALLAFPTNLKTTNINGNRNPLLLISKFKICYYSAS